jgi:hypothetical protein
VIAYDDVFGEVTWSAIRTRSGSDAAFILRFWLIWQNTFLRCMRWHVMVAWCSGAQ